MCVCVPFDEEEEEAGKDSGRGSEPHLLDLKRLAGVCSVVGVSRTVE